MEVIQINQNLSSSVAKDGATIFHKLSINIKLWFVNLFDKLGVPGIIREFDYHDKLTNQKITIKSHSLFTKLTVNNRDYYFNRLTGKFDGTGSGTTCY